MNLLRKPFIYFLLFFSILWIFVKNNILYADSKFVNTIYVNWYVHDYFWNPEKNWTPIYIYEWNNLIRTSNLKNDEGDSQPKDWSFNFKLNINKNIDFDNTYILIDNKKFNLTDYRVRTVNLNNSYIISNLSLLIWDKEYEDYLKSNSFSSSTIQSETLSWNSWNYEDWPETINVTSTNYLKKIIISSNFSPFTVNIEKDKLNYFERNSLTNVFTHSFRIWDLPLNLNQSYDFIFSSPWKNNIKETKIITNETLTLNINFQDYSSPDLSSSWKIENATWSWNIVSKTWSSINVSQNVSFSGSINPFLYNLTFTWSSLDSWDKIDVYDSLNKKLWFCIMSNWICQVEFTENQDNLNILIKGTTIITKNINIKFWNQIIPVEKSKIWIYIVIFFSILFAIFLALYIWKDKYNEKKY